jgi:hypothetical protein
MTSDRFPTQTFPTQTIALALYHFCTYFDRNYLTRGLALYRSLEKHCHRLFVLWVVCFDDETHDRLMRLDLPGMRLIRRHEFEANDPALAKARTDRTSVEYFWTCTPSVMLFVLRQDPTIAVLTYLDADLYFFSDPEPIFREFGEGSILIIGHRYAPEHAHFAETAGIYNVGLMSFRSDSNGVCCLQWWRERCIEWCFARFEDGKFGDQKYLDDWPERFPGVVVLQHKGAGIGPWNLSAYRTDRCNGAVEVEGHPLIFYHFHGLKCVSSNVVAPNGREYRIGAFQLKHIHHQYVTDLRAAAASSRMSFIDAFVPSTSNMTLLKGIMNQTFFLIRPKWLSVILWSLRLLRNYMVSMAKAYLGDAQTARYRRLRDYLKN